ncbi:efflux RND transporter periplasmic adaptor subunit [Sandarakinorhabdus sp.]|jgi:membrane fusion protein (multidrug efflux system)|uniref:HlyD family secretion protein n=1 Tax=Sandarakinorhabdus sp. TaxID=1916663 RepID=UPI00356B34EF
MNQRVAPPETGTAADSRWRSRILMLSVPLLVVAAGLWLWLSGLGLVTTDNAYVRVDKVTISSDVTSRVRRVFVGENMPVRRGQVVIELVDTPFRIALAEAEARLANARREVRGLRNDTGGSAAGVAAKREALNFALTELQRQQTLLERGFATRARLQQAQYAVANARAELTRALSDDAAARTAADGMQSVEQHPLVLAAAAMRDKAAFELARTRIISPAAGIATQTSRVLPGQVMVQGVAALSVMVTDSAYIEANFKETELQDMRVGQRAEVQLDAFPSHVLRGRVDSIGVGTGSEFSVLPAQNATGNWVKVVQRVPVRIKLDGKPPVPLIAGLSAEVKVITK